MLTIVAFLIAIGILVTLHELGHYWVARRCGVRVLRFSVGFGKPLFSWEDRHGTEWCLAPIPLGGYVKMLDRYETSQPESWRDETFESRRVGQRMAIVAAGPVSNLVLAVLLYAMLAWSGMTVLLPRIGFVVPESPAAVAGIQSGDTVLAINEREVTDWRELRLALMEALVDTEYGIRFTTSAGVHHVPSSALTGITASPAGLAAFGVSPQRLLPVVAAVEPNSPAFDAGLRQGDRVTAFGEQRVQQWSDLVAAVQRSQGESVTLTFEREGHTHTATLTPQYHERTHSARIGLMPEVDQAWLDALHETRTVGGIDGVQMGIERTWRDVSLSLNMLFSMVSGKVSTDNLSGPVTIATMAGETARRGLNSYLEFLALVSVSLAVLNLLPIPMLDGGHLLYYVAEFVRGRPVSERFQALGQRVGLGLLLLLMAFAMFNDFNRLFAG